MVADDIHECSRISLSSLIGDTMSFLEAHNGYVGIGATSLLKNQVLDKIQTSQGSASQYVLPDNRPTVFRTAQEAAADIDRYGAETADIRKQGGLRAQELAFKYSAAKGRMEALKQQILEHEKEIASLQKTIEDRVNELARLGVMSIGDIAKKIGQMGIAKMVPGIGWIMFGLELFGIDIFGSKKKKQRKAQEILAHLEQLAARLKWVVGRVEALNAEGHSVSQAFESGPQSFQVNFAPLAQKTEKVISQADATKEGVPLYSVKKVVSDVKDTYLRTAGELQARQEGGTATGARLPVGFQQIYSPALANKSIVAKVEKNLPEGQAFVPVIGKKVVYGGLTGLEDMTYPEMFMWASLAMGAAFATMLALEPAPKPIRRRVPMYRPKMVG